MKIKRLNLSEIKKIYRKHLFRDFPRDERRPLTRIVKYFREHRYEGFAGYNEAGELLCYAFFMMCDYTPQNKKRQRACLFDYLAVTEKHRDAGVGSEFLHRLAQCFPRTDIMFVEVENTDYAVDEADHATKQRRRDFYLRNGMLDTDVTVRVWGVEYRIMEMALGDDWCPHTAQEIREACEHAYHSMFPPVIYDHYILVR